MPGGATPFTFERPPRDRRWVALFAFTWAVCIGVGIFGAVNRCAAFSIKLWRPKSN